MAGMLAKIKDRWANRHDRDALVMGLPVRARRVRKANRAREKDALRRQERRDGEQR